MISSLITVSVETINYIMTIIVLLYTHVNMVFRQNEPILDKSISYEVNCAVLSHWPISYLINRDN